MLPVNDGSQDAYSRSLENKDGEESELIIDLNFLRLDKKITDKTVKTLFPDIEDTRIKTFFPNIIEETEDHDLSKKEKIMDLTYLNSPDKFKPNEQVFPLGEKNCSSEEESFPDPPEKLCKRNNNLKFSFLKKDKK